MIEERADVVVIGGGIAGHAAACAAAQAGNDVLLLEKGPETGGSAALSGGTIWTGTRVDQVRAIMKGGDPRLVQVVVEQFDAAIRWLADLGIPLQELPAGPYRFERRVFEMVGGASAGMRAFAEQLRRLGGRIRCNVAAQDLLQDEEGQVRGVHAWTDAGGLVVEADAVILASGGFQGNRELIARYIGRYADLMPLRANPYSTGDGLLMGLAAGAATSAGMGAFYGHLLPAPPARVDFSNFTRVTPYFSEHAIVVNALGRRFADESRGDEVTAQDAARQPDARCWLLFDSAVHRAYAVLPGYAGAPALDKVVELQEAGAAVVVADTLDALVAGAAATGVNGPALGATLAEYNEAVADGQLARLDVPRRANPEPLARPPFYAVPMLPGITFTHGGLRIDESARVQDRRGRPIPGLFAAGADAGVWYEGYAGGLVLGLVFGRIAGSEAVKSRSRPPSLPGSG